MDKVRVFCGEWNREFVNRFRVYQCIDAAYDYVNDAECRRRLRDAIRSDEVAKLFSEPAVHVLPETDLPLNLKIKLGEGFAEYKGFGVVFTYDPVLVNYFEPEVVRVVREDGYVADFVKLESLLAYSGPGEVWLNVRTKFDYQPVPW